MYDHRSDNEYSKAWQINSVVITPYANLDEVFVHVASEVQKKSGLLLQLLRNTLHGVRWRLVGDVKILHSPIQNKHFQYVNLRLVLGKFFSIMQSAGIHV